MLSEQLRLANSTVKYELIYLSLNTNLDFLFSAMKNDAQLAAMLIKTTPLLPKVFSLMKTIINSGHAIKYSGLITIFVERLTKLLHLSLLHPQDYSVDIVSKFMFEKPIQNGKELSRNWQYLIKMFDLVE